MKGDIPKHGDRAQQYRHKGDSLIPLSHAELITIEQRSDTSPKPPAASSKTQAVSFLNLLAPDPAKHLFSQCDHRALPCSCRTGYRRGITIPFAANLHARMGLKAYQKLLAPQSCSHDLPDPLILWEVFTGGVGDVHVSGFSSTVTLQKREAKLQVTISAQHEAPQTQFLRCLWALVTTEVG